MKPRSGLVFVRVGVVRMNLNRELVGGVDKFSEQWEGVAVTFGGDRPDERSTQLGAHLVQSFALKGTAQDTVAPVNLPRLTERFVACGF